MKKLIPILAALLIPVMVTAQVRSFRAVLARKNAGTAAPTPEILWWKVQDSTAQTGDGTNGGDDGTTDASRVTGKSGSGFALDWNGTTGDAQTDASITYGSQIITISFWLYPDTVTGTRILLESSANWNSNNDAWNIFFDSGNLYFGMKDNGSGFRTEHITAPATGAWIHYLVVLDQTAGAGVGDVILYENGASKATTVGTNTKATARTFAPYVMYAGSRGRASDFSDARMDDLRIYSTNKSADVAAIYGEAE